VWKETAVLTAKPRLRIVGQGAGLRVRQRGNWAADKSAALRESCRASIAIEKTLVEAIGRARAIGMSWAELGRVLGATDHADNKQTLIDALADNRRAILEHLLGGTT
jgi:hypothetical protein